MNTLAIALAAVPPIKSLLIGFLVIVIILAVIGGLIYCIEQWIIKGPLPTPVRLVIGLILIVLVIIWGIEAFGGN